MNNEFLGPFSRVLLLQSRFFDYYDSIGEGTAKKMIPKEELSKDKRENNVSLKPRA